MIATRLSYARSVLERALQPLGGQPYAGDMSHPAGLAHTAAHLGRVLGLCTLSPDPMDEAGGTPLRAGFTPEDGLSKMGEVQMPSPYETDRPRPGGHPQWPGSAFEVGTYLLVDVLHDQVAMAAIRDSAGSLRAGLTRELVRIYELACKALEGQPLP